MPGASNPPKPFQRPGIRISTEKRDWKEVPASLIESGDIVRGMGEAVEVDTDRPGVTIVWKNGTRSIYDAGDVVTAFVKV